MTPRDEPLRVSGQHVHGVLYFEDGVDSIWPLGKGPEEEGGIRAWPHAPGLGTGGSYLLRQGCRAERWQWAPEEGV